MTGNAPSTPQQISPPPGSPTGHGYAVAPKTNTLAIVSFVSSFFVGLVAIITGHIALGQIRARGEAGRGFALAGLIIGYVAVAATAVSVIVAVFFAAAFAAFFATTGPGAGGVTSSSEAPADSLGTVPEGQLGAANFDEGYLELGTGPVVIDEFFDPMCPYCKVFDDTNGPQLALAVENNAITLRLHSLNFLDRYSEGTEYSTRAGAALTCEAAINPDTTLDYLAALYANQPAENTSGLTDSELVALSTGSSSIESCVSGGEYQLWNQINNDAAFAGAYAGLPAISSSPTVFVDGEQYVGAPNDAVGFSTFVSGFFQP
ncbi:DUF4190 domain-containing protein [Cryobacterium melibiosiphilum]|uniref:DUF4190 domain-containing protein n=1 Tax=Cryobacterium melibiosiphilum TaxID=995039 RepID=A0A3A5MR61_9MICO|nr:DUF4190 domain-containing protein [Cryobacterium melibiosiphilum]RJT89503.1 DUF4190 domain-containing protein [Cryobacterium melibiosiphilum]